MQQPLAPGTADTGKLLVRPTGRASAELLAAAAGAALGQPVDAATARAAADQLYASGDFERVEVQSALLPDGRALILVPVEAPWRRNPLRLGLELQTEQGTREDATRFALTATTTLRALNDWGGELRALLRLGSQSTLMGEWWQPLGPGSKVFGLTSWRRDAETQGIYSDGQRVTQLGVAEAKWRLGAGVSLGRSGDVQVGLERSRSRVSPLLRADLESGSIAFTTTQVYAQMRVDTLDSIAFPTRGTLLQATWRSGSLSEADRGSEAEARLLTGFTWGRWAGHVHAETSHASKGVAPLALGGVTDR